MKKWKIQNFILVLGVSSARLEGFHWKNMKRISIDIYFSLVFLIALSDFKCSHKVLNYLLIFFCENFSNFVGIDPRIGFLQPPTAKNTAKTPKNFIFWIFRKFWKVPFLQKSFKKVINRTLGPPRPKGPQGPTLGSHGNPPRDPRAPLYINPIEIHVKINMFMWI